ncbi:MAG: carbohydrate ABC transporter permease [Caldilineae bacterium]|nr:carbohydrate ABC transporter permease [Anaerolineae bacterium]MCB0204716.1 carbohydrate ABC transporter permease [Anaerolineae bacterium]MCB0255708.1 carbohydrate ABC transporter permease [Anaerolineae bacterium]MCB9153427.1 carbohydrate ABC transporter permease [Caldilineae bacterium]
MSRESWEELIFGRILRWIGIVFFFVICAFPLYYMIMLSFTDIQVLLTNPSRLLPDLGSIWPPKSYIDVLAPIDKGGQGFMVFIRNSFMVAVVTTAITMVVCIMAAYAATRLKFRGKGAVNWGLILVYMVPAIVLAIPLFVIYSQTGLRSTVPKRLVALTIVYLTATLPVAIYMLRGYFATIPVDMEEAAMIDGCSRLQTVWKIVIPLSVPAIAAAALYVFMIAWNEYLYALLFLLDNPNSWTLSLGVNQLDSQEVPRTMLMAGSVIITLPVVVLFIAFERYLVGGLTAGGVKG